MCDEKILIEIKLRRTFVRCSFIFLGWERLDVFGKISYIRVKAVHATYVDTAIIMIDFVAFSVT